MKSGAEVLTAAVRTAGEILLVTFPLAFPFPLAAGVVFCFGAAFFFVTPDFGDLAGGFLAGAFLVLAMV